MNAKGSKSYTKEQLEKMVAEGQDRTDLQRLDAMRDEDIDTSDIAELDDAFFEKATMVWPPSKRQLTIRLDEDVLSWLKSQGRGYQTRINRILRAAMESQNKPRDNHAR